MSEPVKEGQRWRHVRTGVERTVFAVCTYRERTGCYPGDFEEAFGITHIAAMTPNPNDRRDSSDMPLVDGRPFASSSWERLP